MPKQCDCLISCGCKMLTTSNKPADLLHRICTIAGLSSEDAEYQKLFDVLVAAQPSAKALTDEAIMEIADKHGWVIKQTGRMEWLVCSTNTPSNMLALARAFLAAEQPQEMPK